MRLFEPTIGFVILLGGIFSPAAINKAHGQWCPVVTDLESLNASPAAGFRDDDPAPFTPPGRFIGDVIVYTAHQGWLSRIYVLRMDGSVITYFEYDFYFFADLEVVDNEVYAAEAFAPRVYRVDLETRDLDVVVDDWTLYYFYGLAFDGTFFYVDEWDLNRYELDGTKDGMASFDESVAGGAWDGAYYWTLNDDENQVKCWDVSTWPAVTQIPENSFTPPSPACRGLWFDGQYFWTAESIEDHLGFIYQFDYDGKVVDQWREPAFSGWGACVVTGDLAGDFDGDGDVDLADFGAFATCFTGPGGGPVAPECEPGDFDFDGDIDCDDWDQFVLAWTEPGEPPGLPQCLVPPPLVAPAPHDQPKNRFVSFSPNHNDMMVAFRVEMTTSTYFPESTGPVGWVGQPNGDDVSRIVEEPFFADSWPAVIHAGDCETVPVATYHLRATVDGITFTEPLEIGTITQPAPKYWADCVGSLEGAAWTGPNGVVNMDDVMAAVQRFQLSATAPHLTWVDVDPDVPNAVLNFTDIFQIVQGFKGEPYPFSAPGECP